MGEIFVNYIWDSKLVSRIYKEFKKQESRKQITQLKMGHGSERSYKFLTLPIREIWIKTTLRFHFTPVKTSKIKIPDNKCCWGCRQKKPPFTWVGLQPRLATTEIHAKTSHRAKRRYSIWHTQREKQSINSMTSALQTVNVITKKKKKPATWKILKQSRIGNWVKNGQTRQFWGVGSLLPFLHGLWGLNSEHQVCVYLYQHSHQTSHQIMNSWGDILHCP